MRDQANVLVISWRPTWKPSGTDGSLWSPPAAAASCPSFWVWSRYVETLTLNTAWRCLDGTLIMLVICWTTTERSRATTHSEVKSVHGMSCTDKGTIHVCTRGHSRRKLGSRESLAENTYTFVLFNSKFVCLWIIFSHARGGNVGLSVGWLVSPPLKYLQLYKVNWHEIWCRHW